MGIISAIGKGVEKAATRMPNKVALHGSTGPLKPHMMTEYHGGSFKKVLHVNAAKTGAMGGAGAAGIGMGNHFAHNNDAGKNVY